MHKDQRIAVTTSTNQSPPEPTGRSDGPEIFRPLRKREFHFHARKTTNTGPCPAPNPRLYRVIKKSLCTLRLYCNHQVHRDFLITLYILRLLRFILILLCNLHLRFQNDLVSSTFPPKILYVFILSSMTYTRTTQSRPPLPIFLTVFSDEYTL